jgi:hypothetical protein
MPQIKTKRRTTLVVHFGRLRLNVVSHAIQTHDI